MNLHRTFAFVLTIAALLLLVACQPIQPVASDAGSSSMPADAPQATTIVLPDGTKCAWAGTGATLAFDGKRVNYTCSESAETIIALLGDPTPGDIGVWSVEQATIKHGSDGFTLESSATVTFLAATLDLSDGATCAFAGTGATMAFDGQRLNYTCGEPGDAIVGIIGDLIAGEAGVISAEKVVIDRSGSEPTIKESNQVAINQLNGAALADAAGTTEGTTAMTDNELIGVVWQWQSTQMNDDTTFTPDDPAKYTLTFLPDNKVQMQADCNKGGGLYQLAGNQLTLGPIATTLMACLPDSLDSTFSQQLNAVASYLMDNGNLVLELKMDSGSMTFAPAASAGTGSDSANTATTDATLSGAVSYLQRIALLPGAVIEVQLQDSTGAIVASQTLTTTGENVPIGFTLAYDPAQIDEQGAYALVATIALNGEVRWTNAEPVAVLTNGAPTNDVEILVQPKR